MAIEAFTAVLLQLNIRYKTRVAPKLTGIKRDPRGAVTMRLYDTARRSVVPFEPPEHVLMYTCGITPYDATHLGHAATYLAYDVLQRRLIDLGHRVTCVRNVTDVDDPLFAKARQLGVHYLDLAAGEEARFEADMEALNALPVASRPRASSAIADIRGFIGMVIDRGFAYEAGGSVFFDVSKFDRFGSVSHYSREQMLEFARQRGGDVDNPHKRDPLDFVLWQPSAPDEPSWDTLWGPGRPGWHIECSALALRELGSTIHLHGGGTDLIFPHHECERAQSEAATGEPFVQHWMHTALISKDGEKMSKSLGNLVFVDALRKEWDAAAIRLAIIGHHYRTEWEWDEELMPQAQQRLDAWRAAAAGRRRGGRRARRRARAARRRPRHARRVRRHRRCGRGRRERLPRSLPRPNCSASCCNWTMVKATGAGDAQRRARRVLAPFARRLWDIELHGFERLPETGPAILCPNHISFLDSAFLMLSVPRNISFVGKAEYMQSWKTKYLFPVLGMIPIDRAGGSRSAAALEVAAEVLRRGELFGIYPEGTRSRDGKLHKGRTGAARLALEVGVPIYPGRHRRHRSDPAARRQRPQAVPFVLDLDRAPDPPGALRIDAGAAPGVPGDDRRGDVRDPRADRPGVRRPLRRARR